MADDNNRRRKFYDALTQDGYNLGTYEQFNSSMNDPSMRRKYYDAISQTANIGDFDYFDTAMNGGAKVDAHTMDHMAKMKEDSAHVAEMEAELKAKQAIPTGSDSINGQKYRTEGLQAQEYKDEGWQSLLKLQGKDLNDKLGRLKKYSDLGFEDATNTLNSYKDYNNKKKQLEAAKASNEKAIKENLAKKPWSFLSASPSITGAVSYTRPVGDDDYKNLDAERRSLTRAQKNLNAMEKHMQAGDTPVDVGALGRGLADQATDLAQWDYGYSDYTDAKQLYKIKNKLDNGEELTPSEQRLLQASAIENWAGQETEDKQGALYTAGKTTMYMAPFMLEMAVNPITGLTRTAGEAAAKALASKVGSGMMKAVARGVAKTATSLAGGAGMAFTTGALRSEADATSRMTGGASYTQDDYGNIQFDGFEGAKNWLTSHYQAYMSQAIEEGTEMLGGELPIGKVYNSLLAKGAKSSILPIQKVAKAIGAISEDAKPFYEFLGKAGWNGILEEATEEEIGIIGNSLLVRDENSDISQLWDPKTQRDIFLGVGLFGAFTSTIATGAFPIRYRMAKNNLDKAESAMRDKFSGEDISEQLEQVRNASPDDAQEILGAVIDNSNMSDEQKEAYLNYQKALTQWQGVNLAVAMRPEGYGMPKNDEDAYVEGTHTEEPEAVHAAARQAEASEDAFKQQYPQAYTELKKLIDDGNGAKIVEDYVSGLEPEAQALANQYKEDYYRLKGVADGTDDTITARVNEYKKKAEPGVVIEEDGTRTITTAQTNDGKPIFILAMSDDDKMTVVVDAETGETLPPMSKDNIAQGTVRKYTYDDYISAYENDTRKLVKQGVDMSIMHNPKTSLNPEAGTIIYDGDQQYSLRYDNDGNLWLDPYRTDNNGNVIDTSDEAKRTSLAEVVSLQDAYYNATDDINNGEGQEQQPQAEQQVTPEQEVQPAEQQEAQSEEQQPAEAAYPTDENGEPLYTQATPESTIDYIYNQNGLSEDEADTFLNNQKKSADKKLESSNKKQPKPKEGESLNSFKQRKQQWQKEYDEAKSNADYWKSVSSARQQQKDAAEQAEKERLAAEKAEAERKMAEAKKIYQDAQDISNTPDISVDNAKDARERGFRNVNGFKVSRQEPLEGLEGSDVSIKFSNNDVVNGRYKIINADKLQPSHINQSRNPQFFISEAQPKERTDLASQAAAERIARNINPEEITSGVTAYVGSPIVNSRGEVIQGNNRSNALKIMMHENGESAAKYKQYLIDHAEEFGLNPDEVAQFENPVLVRTADLNDEEAIRLGNMSATDTETGGNERIKAKQTVQKLTQAQYGTFVRYLLEGEEDDTLSQLLDTNGYKALKYLNEVRAISDTQMQSALDANKNVTGEAKNDLFNLLSEYLFEGGNDNIRNMFANLPAKAQKAILSTIGRDAMVENDSKLRKDMQTAIEMFNEAITYETFADAKNYENAKKALEEWMNQGEMFETGLPKSERFDNFAIELAARFKGSTMSHMQGLFNEYYDLVEGANANLFNMDAEPVSAADAIKQVFNVERRNRNDVQGSNALAGSDQQSEEGRSGSKEPTGEREQEETSEEPADDSGRVADDNQQGEEVDNQGNPVDKDGRLILENVKDVFDITDRDINEAYRNIRLPKIPENLGNAIGANGKDVIIKKNIFEKNKIHHPDLTPRQSKEILKDALYSADLYGNNQKSTRPYNWIVIHLAKNSSTIVLEVNENKDNVEIVGWHYAGEKQLEQIKRRALNEGGQILILNNSAVGLSDVTESSFGKDTTSSSENQISDEENAGSYSSDEHSIAEGAILNVYGLIFHDDFNWTDDDLVKNLMTNYDLPENEAKEIVKWVRENYKDEEGNGSVYQIPVGSVSSKRVDTDDYSEVIYWFKDFNNSWNKPNGKKHIEDVVVSRGKSTIDNIVKLYRDLGDNEKANFVQNAYNEEQKRVYPTMDEAVGKSYAYTKDVEQNGEKYKSGGKITFEGIDKNGNITGTYEGFDTRRGYTNVREKNSKFSWTPSEFKSNIKNWARKSTPDDVENYENLKTEVEKRAKDIEEQTKINNKVEKLLNRSKADFESGKKALNSGNEKAINSWLEKFKKAISKCDDKEFVPKFQSWLKGCWNISAESDSDINKNFYNNIASFLENKIKELGGDIPSKPDVLKGEEQPKENKPEPSGNKVFTDERHAEVVKRLKQKFGQLNAGIDYETALLTMECAGWHIEKGTRKFVQFCKEMIAELGDACRPYLKTSYNSIRDFEGMEEYAKDMDSYDDVKKFDVANFDKDTPDRMETVKEVKKEHEVNKQAEQVKDDLPKSEDGKLQVAGFSGEINDETGYLTSPDDAREWLNDKYNAQSTPIDGGNAIPWIDKLSDEDALVLYRAERYGSNEDETEDDAFNVFHYYDDLAEGAIKSVYDYDNADAMVKLLEKYGKVFNESEASEEAVPDNQSNQTEVPNEQSGYTITDAKYTTKRGKVLEMKLVKFDELTDEQKKDAKEEAQKKDTKPASANKIEDVGEKIGGARKDVAVRFAKDLKENGTKLSEIFPKPNFSSLLKSGIPVESLIEVKALYFVAKMFSKKKRIFSRNLDVVRMLGKSARYILFKSADMETDDVAEGIYNKTKAVISNGGYIDAVKSIVGELGNEYLDVDFFDISIPQEYSYRADEMGYYVANDGSKYVKVEPYKINSKKFYQVEGRTLYDSKEEAFDKYVELVGKAHSIGDKARPVFKIHVYVSASKGPYIALSINKDIITLKDGFKTPKEAIEYREKYRDELNIICQKIADERRKGDRGKSNDDIEREIRNIVERGRVGKDWRNGKDITADEFRNKFGFRGVEFGNWANQKERQIHLNKCYDALMDLSEILEISPKAISLGGKLGFAFGARGAGKALAHYEAERNVINLTKKRGAGCVAHEWFHALDWYLSGDVFTPSTEGKYKNGTREALKDAFSGILKSIRGTEYNNFAGKIDSGKDKPYWSLPTELGARAFEAFVKDRLYQKGQINDYLSSFNVDPDYDGETPGFYPVGDELVKIGEAFENVFDTIEEKTDEETGIVSLYEPSAEFGGTTYTDRTGDKVQYKSLFDWDEEEAQGSDKKAEANKSNQSKPQKSPSDPTQIGLRPLEEGEFCNVERIYREDKYYSFVGGKTRISTYEDVAFMFKALEDSSIEHAFVALIKDGKPTIIHLSTGGLNTTLVDLRLAVPAISAINPDSIFMVHNHPSGGLEPSADDKRLLKSFVKAFGPKVKDGIIIDTFSGQFGTFNEYSNDKYEEIEPTSTQKVKVYSFDKQKFNSEWPNETLDGSDRIAEFVSTQRLGRREKIGALIVDSRLGVTGNIYLPYDHIQGNERKIADDIAFNAIKMGGIGVVLYGNNLDYRNARNVYSRLSNYSIRLFDAIVLKHGITSWGNNQYESANDNGLLEPEAEYRRNPITEEPQTSINEEEGTQNVTEAQHLATEAAKSLVEDVVPVKYASDEMTKVFFSLVMNNPGSRLQPISNITEDNSLTTRNGNIPKGLSEAASIDDVEERAKAYERFYSRPNAALNLSDFRVVDGNIVAKANGKDVYVDIRNPYTMKEGIANPYKLGIKRTLKGTMNTPEQDAMIVWHGSGAKFDKFDTMNHLGEGEGAQAYGIGTYVSTIRSTGEMYAAKAYRNKIYNDNPASYTDAIDKAKASVRDYIKGGFSFEKAIENAKTNDIFTRSFLKKGDEYYEELSRKIEAYDTFTPENIMLDNIAKMLYKVEVPDDNGNNYLDWNKWGKSTDELAKKVSNALVETQEGKDYMKSHSDEEWVMKDFVANLSGKTEGRMYFEVSSILGGGYYMAPEKAVELFRKLGYVGVKVPTGNMRGGDGRGMNYVIFNDDDLKIVEKIPLLSTKNGALYGWARNGVVYLSKKGINPNTPIHEYAHLWADAVQQKNPTLWNDIKSKLRGSDVWNEVVADPAYKHIRGIDDSIASEVISRLSGRKGAELLNKMAKDVLKEPNMTERVRKMSVIHKLRDAVRKFWNYVSNDIFHMDHFNSAEDIPMQVLSDLVNKTDISTNKNSGKLEAMASSELDEKYPSWNDTQTTSKGGHSTQISGTTSTYKKIGDWIKNNGLSNADILDASSGKGLGTQALREMGLNVDDVEPFAPNDRTEAPTYSSYDSIDKDYDVIISNAVLNVIPDDWRADVLKNMAAHLKDGGKMIINTRGASEAKGVKNKVELDEPTEILTKNGNGGYRSYQKFFTHETLTKFIKDTLGDGFSVENATKSNSGIANEQAVVVTKEDTRFNLKKPSDFDSIMDYVRYMADAHKSGKTERARKLNKIRRERINNNMEKVTKFVDNYINEHGQGLKEICIVNSLMSDEDLSNITGLDPIKDEDYLNDLKRIMPKSCGGNLRGKNIIVIIADNYIDDKDLENTITHERIHSVFENYPAYVDYLWNKFKDRPEFQEFIGKLESYYSSDKVPEEFCCYIIAEAIIDGKVEKLRSYLGTVENDYLTYIFNKIGYDENGKTSFGISGRDDKQTEKIRKDGYERKDDSVNLESGFDRKTKDFSGTIQNGKGERQKREINLALIDINGNVLHPSNDPDVTVLEDEIGEAAEQYERDLQQNSYKLQESWQDSMLGLKKMQEAVAKATNKPIMDYENAYYAENAMSSINRNQQERFRKLLYDPMKKEVANLKKQGAKTDEIRDYLMAKHGIERNQVLANRDAKKYADEWLKDSLHEINKQYGYALRGLNSRLANGTITMADYNKELAVIEAKKTKETNKVNNDYPTVLKNRYDENRLRDYSGLTGLTEEDDVAEAENKAKQIADDFESKYDTKNLWDRIHDINNYSLAKMYEGGLMDKEEYDRQRNMFQYYIPLRGFEETTSDEVYDYLLSSRSQMNSPMKSAKGRKSVADDPLCVMGNMAESAIIAANRNLMKQRFLLMVENHPTDLASINPVWMELDDVTGEWKLRLHPDIPANATAAQTRQLMQDFNKQMEELAEQQPNKYKKASDKDNIPYRTLKQFMGEHQVFVKRNGKNYIITINGNPRAAQAVNGLTNPDSNLGTISKLASSATRFMASMYTAQSVNFIPRNLVRDGLYTNSILYAKEGSAYAWEYNKNWARSMRHMASLLHKYNNGTLDDNVPIERMFREFVENGGETGFTRLNSVEDYKKYFEKELKKAEGNKLSPRAALDLYMKGVEGMNRWAECISRFAAYKTSREAGRSLSRAIFDAKEVSVNFDKKGSGAKTIGDKDSNMIKLAGGLSQFGRNFYAFFNAGIQGIANISGVTKKNPKKFAAFAGGIFLAGAFAPLVNMAISALCGGDDDDDDYYNLPDYVRRNNICLGINGKWLVIPLGQEMRAIYGLGELASDVMGGNYKKGVTNGTIDAISQVSQALPFDFMEATNTGGLSGFMPTSLRPFAEIHDNKNWTGDPLWNDSPYNKLDPMYKKQFKSTSKPLIWLSKEINYATGGNEGKQGFADGKWVNNPSTWSHLFENYLGGAATLFSQTYKTAQGIVDPETFDVHNVPVIGSFVRGSNPNTKLMGIRDQFYDINDQMDIIEHEVSAYKKLSETPSDDKVKRLEDMKHYNDLRKSDAYRTLQTWKQMDKQLKKIDKERNPEQYTEYMGRMIKMVKDAEEE